MERNKELYCPENPISSYHADQKSEHNIKVQIKVMDDKSLFTYKLVTRGLIHTFNNKKASREQNHDLLQLRAISIGEMNSC